MAKYSGKSLVVPPVDFKSSTTYSSTQLSSVQAKIAAYVEAGDVSSISSYQKALVDDYRAELDRLRSTKAITEAEYYEGLKAILNNQVVIEQAKSDAINSYEEKTGNIFFAANENEVGLEKEDIDSIREAINAKPKFRPNSAAVGNTGISMVGLLTQSMGLSTDTEVNGADVLDSLNEKRAAAYNKNFPALLLDSYDAVDEVYKLGGKTFTEEQARAEIARWQSVTGFYFDETTNEAYQAELLTATEEGLYYYTDPTTGEQKATGITVSEENNQAIDNILNGGTAELGAVEGDYSNVKVNPNSVLAQFDIDEDGILSVDEANRSWLKMTNRQRADLEDTLAAAGFAGDGTALGTEVAFKSAVQYAANTYADGAGIDADFDTIITNKTKEPGVGATSAKASEQEAMAVAAQQLAAFESANGYDIDDNVMKGYINKIVKGQTTINDVIGQLRKKLSDLYPTLAENFAAGENLDEIADPYRKAIAEAFEYDPSDIDLDDPTLQKALLNVDENGNYWKTPVWQLKQELRKDPRYNQTTAAMNTWGALAAGIRREFQGV